MSIDDDSNGSEKVVQLRPDLPPLDAVERSAAPDCKHRQVIVDEQRHLVSCRTCGLDLDPLFVLLQYAKEERRFHYASEWRRREQAELNTSIDKLKAEESRIKARLRNARRGLNEVVPPVDGELVILREIAERARRFAAYGHMARLIKSLDDLRGGAAP